MDMIAISLVIAIVLVSKIKLIYGFILGDGWWVTGLNRVRPRWLVYFLKNRQNRVFSKNILGFEILVKTTRHPSPRHF